MAKYPSSTVSGEKSWSWSTYIAKVHDLDARYDGYPMGINLERKWWTSQIDRTQLTYTTHEVGALSTELRYSVSYGTAVSIDGDPDLEILQTGWWPLRPDGGHFAVADFKNGKLVSATVSPISGASNIWVLKSQNGAPPLIVLTGEDEGKLGTTVENQAVSETLIYDQATKSLVHTGIFNTSHESTVIDFDHDGDEDILTANWWQPADGSLVWLRNDGTKLTAVPVPGTIYLGAMSVEVADLDNDGRWEVLLGDPGPVLPGINPQRNSVFTIQDDGSLLFKYEMPLPYFERDTFHDLTTVANFENGFVGRSHDVTIVAGDIDGDGDEDVLVSSAIWNNDTPFSVFQVLINHGGTLVDETDTRMFGLLFAGGGTSHNFLLQDVNQDGFLDIVVQGGNGLVNQPDAEAVMLNGTTLWINDGLGHFVTSVAYQLGNEEFDRFTFSLENGRAHWTRFIERGDGHLDVEVIESKFALSTGPGLTNPALKGAPGFNEFYYLLHNPDVAAKVEKGKLKDGLTHFLAAGQDEGRKSFAAGAHVLGSDKADNIKLREGNETADGGLGKDKIKGGAGADTFVFSTKLGPANVDTIKDFKPRQGDLIALDAGIFKKVGATVDEGEFYAKNGATKAHDKDDRIVYDSKSGKLYYDDDGSKKGGHDAIHFATLTTKPPLDHGDFVIV